MALPRVFAAEQPLTHLKNLELLYSPFRYEEPLRSVLVKAKYGGEPYRLMGLLREFLREIPDARNLHYPDAVVPIPTGRRRRRRRGFDQAILLARGVASAFQIPMLGAALSRQWEVLPQAGLDRAQRLSNLEGVFKADGVFGRSVLLIDDVVTTGGTLTCAAGALLSAGARRVMALTLARTDLQR